MTLLTASNTENITMLFTIIASLSVISAVAKGIIDGSRKRGDNFNLIVSQLNSNNKVTQLSSTLLLRKYLDYRKYKKKAIFVISSLSRVLSTGVFQKTLVDSLAYAKNLSGYDLQKANLQDVYLGLDKERIKMYKTDLFMADLSSALIKNIDGDSIVFYRSILFDAKIKNCDFTNADFRFADLTNTSFEDVVLKNANFQGAINIPEVIKKDLINGKYPCAGKVTFKCTADKTIFFSVPGQMTKEDELITTEYQNLLIDQGYNVIYYTRDTYPSFGQFNRVKESILLSSGMIAFGLKQINIQKGVYRPLTIESENWDNKWLSTPWSEIEIGMGLMKGIPILLVTDPDINTGAFDNALSECYVSRISTMYDLRSIKQNEQFRQWVSKIK